MRFVLLGIVSLTVVFCLVSNGYAEPQIPSWVKNVSKLWSKDQIGDSDFVKSIQYLIQQGVIKIPSTQVTSNSQGHIPSWIKNNANWWSNGTISDEDFLKAIQYLVSVNIIQISPSMNLVLSSSAFENNGTIPVEYTCDGQKISPPLLISNVPKDAKSLVLIVDDPDARPTTFVHWIVWNISPDVVQFSKGEKIPYPQGKSGLGTAGYVGPCPPSGVHRYFFKLYALDHMLQFNDIPTKQDVENAMTGHIIANSTLLGLYSRS